MSILRSLAAVIAAIVLSVCWFPLASANTLSISQTNDLVATDSSSPCATCWQQLNPMQGPSADDLLSGIPSRTSLPLSALPMTSPSTQFVGATNVAEIFIAKSMLTLVAFSEPSEFSSSPASVGSELLPTIVNQPLRPTPTNSGGNRSKVPYGAKKTFTYIHPAPEPPTIMLAGLGVMGVVVADRTRRLRRARATASDDVAEDSNVDD